jgi:cytoskeletal protein RodZ
MKPEDIDKLFKERLGPSSPTPPADLWNRLQDRMEAEMPATTEKEDKRGGFMWLSYSIAAAITLLLAVGIVFFNVQRGTVPVDGDLAQHNAQTAEQPLPVTDPATDQAVAQATAPTAETAPVAPAQTESAAAGTAPVKPTVAANTIAKAESRAAVTKATGPKVEAKVSAPATQLVAKVDKPAIPETVEKGSYYNTGETIPATFASNTADMNAQPVEIIIKRAVLVQQAEEEDEPSGFEKKQKLAKNIFKQVRNFSNGERVELSELGINAERIALETQIGKQKISKVINL